MKTKKYFMISALALLACSCQDEERGGAQPTPGQDVQFGATLEQSASRTVYGDRTGDAYPIYWENGDEVIVSSPECANNGGTGSATYKVNVGDNTTQDYATSLDKTEEHGVCWGDNPTGNFYSFYPASHAELGSDYKTMTVTMPAQQDNNIETDEQGNITVVRPDMEACFMYAGSTASSGETVNLRYIPLSTAVRFTLRGPQSGDPVTVNYVRIYAPQGTVIDGSFTLDFSNASTKDGNKKAPTVTAVNGRNYVTMNAANPETNQYLTLGPGENAELCAFLLLEKEQPINEHWYIEVGLSDGTSLKKSLVASGDTSNMTLVPGKVHNLGELPQLQSGGEWNVANWMTNLQRNVYLSEISIPGSWNSMNSDCQYSANGTDIAEQYSKGVRAFHIDTRWKAGTRENIFGWEVSDWDVIEGLGVADGGDSGTYTEALAQRANRIMGKDAPDFKSVLTEITSHIVGKKEFMVVICTLAQDSYDYNRDNGGWKKEISDICAEMSDVVFDGSKITAETVVQDVLGKVIVIVNTNNDYNLGTSPCLFMNMGITLDETVFTGHLSEGGYYDIPLKYGDTSESGIMMYATHAQRTMPEGENGVDDSDRGYFPSLDERKQMANNIMSWSNRNHDQTENMHNSWIYMGLGGYVDDNQAGYETVKTYFNNWMNNDIIGKMNTTGYYPVGIVLMNDAISEGTSATIKNILQMNNKYRKAYDPHRSPVDGTYIDGTTGKAVQSAAAGYSSGMKDNQINAISWTRCK